MIVSFLRLIDSTIIPLLFLSAITIRRPLTRVSRALDIFLFFFFFSFFLFFPLPLPLFSLLAFFLNLFDSRYVCGARNVTQIAVYIFKVYGTKE